MDEAVKDAPEASPELLEAFALMWGTYPMPASLVHKSRTIMAVNGACRQGGRAPGMNCAKWDSPDRHRGCLADKALREQKSLFKETRTREGVTRVYWLPVPGHPDFYVHFGTGLIPCGGADPGVS